MGLILTGFIALSTHLAIPSSTNWRTAIYTVLGLLLTLAAAYSDGKSQRKIQRGQEDIRTFLMERVNSRKERTAAVIELCKNAGTVFRAVTYFPVVGIQDDPDSAPSAYLNALEESLKTNVKVTLVSASCEEARGYCEQQDFGAASLKAMDWIEGRLNELRLRFPEKLTIITLPGSAITVNVCHNDSTALMYYMSPEDDDGSAGFKSTDPLILAVGKGGADRYISYMERLGSDPSMVSS